jgi:glycyl-tRNA synthetase
VLRFHPAIAPIKAAILPLVNKDGMPELAEKLHKDLKKRWNVFYDDKGAIGRRYRRQDEAGTPFCVTIDGETVSSGVVTVRHRDAMTQDKISLDAVPAWLAERLEA